MSNPSTTEQLAAIAEQLQAVELTETAGHVRQRIADALSVRYELPRGTVVARDEYANGTAVLYVETEHDSRTHELRGVTVTVYAVVHRGDKRTSGSVEVRWSVHPYVSDDEHVHAYWRTLTGSAMPDGARHLIAAAVLAEVDQVMTPELWQILAAETDAAKHRANVSRHISEAVRAIDDARRALGETVSFR
jgi:hypothetical protein